MRILCLFDTSLPVETRKNIDDAFLQYKKTLSRFIDIASENKNADTSGATWDKYMEPDFYGLSTSWIRQDLKRLDHNQYDCVLYFVDKWTPLGNQSVWGWNLGLFYNDMQVQLIRSNQSVRGLFMSISMEIAHSFNDFIWKELGIDVAKEWKVPDYDNYIVHGIAHQYPSWLSDSESIRLFGEQYTMWDYTPLYKKIAPLLLRTFEKRAKRYEDYLRQEITLLTRIVELWKVLRGLLEGEKNEPLIFDS